MACWNQCYDANDILGFLRLFMCTIYRYYMDVNVLYET